MVWLGAAGFCGFRIHLDPAHPDEPAVGLGFNLNTFAPALGMILFGCLILSVGYGVGRLPSLFSLFSR